jgi:hypothetical protein
VTNPTTNHTWIRFELYRELQILPIFLREKAHFKYKLTDLFIHTIHLLIIMSNDQSALYRTKLDELYATIQTLRSSSPNRDFEKFASYFTSECTVYLKSMNPHNMPAISRSEAIEDLQEVLSKLSLESREVLFYTLASDGHTVLCETKKRINVMGEVIEFPETEVVTFDEGGLIKVLKLYSCWSPIVTIVQEKTGYGPYSEGEMWEKFEAPIREMAGKRIEKRKARMGAESVPVSQGGAKATCCS